MAADRAVVREILTRMKDGKTTEEIAGELGIHQVTVARYAQRKNLDDALAMLDMADQGYSLTEVGEKFGVTKQRVAQVIGLEKRLGSKGRKVSINAHMDTWEGMMKVADEHDIPIRNRPGEVDGRAIVQLMDDIADGKLKVVRAY